MKKGVLLTLIILSFSLFDSTNAGKETANAGNETANAGKGIVARVVGKAPWYFKAMKESMVEVVEENQLLINTNPDGSKKNKDLLPEEFYKGIFKTFTAIVKDFEESELTNKKLSVKRTTYLLTSLFQAGRITIARRQKVINSEADGSTKLKMFIPAIFGKKVAVKIEEKTDIKIKQTTLGKGTFSARNPYNKPDEWETMVLEKFWHQIWKGDRGYAERTSMSEYRYMKPIHIKKACLTCHGDPSGGLGPYGRIKEGYLEGEVRGGISIIIPLGG